RGVPLWPLQPRTGTVGISQRAQIGIGRLSRGRARFLGGQQVEQGPEDSKDLRIRSGVTIAPAETGDIGLLGGSGGLYSLPLHLLGGDSRRAICARFGALVALTTQEQKPSLVIGGCRVDLGVRGPKRHPDGLAVLVMGDDQLKIDGTYRHQTGPTWKRDRRNF